jgi:hypothetical protein
MALLSLLHLGFVALTLADNGVGIMGMERSMLVSRPCLTTEFQ